MGKRALAFATIGLVVFGFSSASLFQLIRAKAAISMNTAGFPSIGKKGAPVEVVLIEDFQCKNCRVFSQKVIPKLQSEYVQKGKVRFTLVPVSFLNGSQIIANAALEVNKQRPSQFYPFLKAILAHQGEVRKADLLRLARRLKGIDLSQLEHCIEAGCHDKELDHNLNWARGVMGSQFRTPALYVNGAVGSTYSFEAVRYQIDQILGKSQ